ncbi:hypothetical protein [Maribellus maritimus]|uniref:hypothetical protein n=1 Tax=Maribellus maritimus TaxID=2870838 RepID=UPI001EEB12F7|nr:hypothetical protein [Maribellus maritimus]MCG6191570.1 hypothetical protein [Maribellus maritimus]
MELKILKLSLIVLLFGVTTAGCQKDDFFELNIGDEDAIIQKEVNGIEFKFCLLNEQGEPSTVFDEGENFTFQFSIKNNTGKSLIFHDYSFYENVDFFSVHNRTHNFGRPFGLLPGYLTSNEMRYIHDDMSSSFMCLWQDSRDKFFAMHGAFKGLNKVSLENGRYVTSFTHNFHFGDIETGSLTFKINFKIK